VLEIQWDSKGRFEKAVSVPPGKFAELCGKLAKGDKVGWSFKSEGPVNFNIHHHEGENVAYSTKQTAVNSGEGTLDANSAQEYCWMWSNKGSAEISMTLGLRR